MTNNGIFFWSVAVPFMVFMNALGLAGAIAIIKEAWRQ